MILRRLFLQSPRQQQLLAGVVGRIGLANQSTPLAVCSSHRTRNNPPTLFPGRAASITTTLRQKGNLGAPLWPTGHVLDSFVPLPCRNRFQGNNRPN